MTLRMEPIGSVRLPGVKLLNLRASKQFVYGKQRVSVDADLYNALNANDATTMSVASGPTYGRITAIVPPMVGRIGLRITSEDRDRYRGFFNNRAYEGTKSRKGAQPVRREPRFRAFASDASVAPQDACGSLHVTQPPVAAPRFDLCYPPAERIEHCDHQQPDRIDRRQADAEALRIEKKSVIN